MGKRRPRSCCCPSWHSFLPARQAAFSASLHQALSDELSTHRQSCANADDPAAFDLPDQPEPAPPPPSDRNVRRPAPAFLQENGRRGYTVAEFLQRAVASVSPPP